MPVVATCQIDWTFSNSLKWYTTILYMEKDEDKTNKSFLFHHPLMFFSRCVCFVIVDSWILCWNMLYGICFVQICGKHYADRWKIWHWKHNTMMTSPSKPISWYFLVAMNDIKTFRLLRCECDTVRGFSWNLRYSSARILIHIFFKSENFRYYFLEKIEHNYFWFSSIGT